MATKVVTLETADVLVREMKAYVDAKEVPAATSTTSGTAKLYTSTGTATDGSMTQAAITELIGDVESLLAAI